MLLWGAILVILLVVCLITRCCFKYKYRSTTDEEATTDDGNHGSSQPTAYGSQPSDYGSGNFSAPPPAYSNADGSSPHYQNYALPSAMPPLNSKMAPPSYPPSYEESLHMWFNSWLLNKVITRPCCCIGPDFNFTFQKKICTAHKVSLLQQGWWESLNIDELGNPAHN